MKPRQPKEVPSAKRVTEMAVQIGQQVLPELTWLRDGLLKVRVRRSDAEDLVIDLHNLYREVRDFLIAMQPPLRAKFALQVAQDFRTQNHPVTPKLLRVAGDQIRYEAVS